MTAAIIKKFEVSELLDYGAGKCRLFEALQGFIDRPITYRPYEPADKRYSADPKPSDMVACIDVLEHVEPEYLDSVLDDLKRLTKRVGLFTVHTGPAKKTLPDGRNAHLTQENMDWWFQKFTSRFELQTLQNQDNGFSIFVLAK